MKSANLTRTARRSAKPPARTRGTRAASKHHTRGQRGEDLAAAHLERLGYRILARNWRSALTRNEIDLIAQNRGCVVFVEVKTARTSGFGEPLSWITPRKQAAIIKAALAYMAQWEGPATEFRFDAIGITPSKNGGPPTLEHICGAFTCDQ